MDENTQAKFEEKIKELLAVAKKKKNVHVIGDAASVGNLRTVIWGAWDVAMKL